MTPKAIFFDNDGTLVDTEGIFFEACQETLLRYDVVLTQEWYTDHVMKNHETVGQLFDPVRYNKEDIRRIREERNVLYRAKLRANVDACEGAVELLDYLFHKYSLALITSSERRHLDMILEKIPLRSYFQLIIANEDVENLKPHPEPYLKAAKALGLHPSECIVIEDSERGVRAAKEAGMVCYAIPSALARGNDFSRADKILDDLIELKGLL